MKPLAILLAFAATATAADIIPKAFPKDRYAETLKKSPFVLETKVAEPEVAKVNVFQNLYLSGVGKADGKDYVLVKRIGEDRPMRFIGNEPGPEEYTVKSVRQGGNFRETKVVLQKGTETGEVGFKEDTINVPPPAAAGQNRGPMMPGVFPKPGGGGPPQMPMVRTGPPMPTQPVPRPGGAVPPPKSPQPMNAPSPGGTQMRTRPRGIGN